MITKTDEYCSIPETVSGHHVSALMDGELAGSETGPFISTLQEDSELRKTWERYHLIREVLRDNLPQKLEHQVGANVIAALASEPLHFMPRAARLQSKFKTLAPALKQVSGLAIAASVTAVAILSVQTAWQPTVNNAQVALNQPAAQIQPVIDELAQAAVRPPIANVNGNVLIPSAPMQDPMGEYAQAAAGFQLNLAEPGPAFETKLNHYLTNHNEYALPADVQGMLPYARIVGYDPAE